MARDVTVLVGTTKGAFLIDGAADWSVRGPFCDGWSVNHVIGDPDSGTLWAGGGNDWTGAGIWRSTDGGASWTLAKLSDGKMDAWIAADPEMARTFGMTPAPEAPFSGLLDSIWSLARADGALWAGARPAQLFVSRDRGDSWQRVEALTDHPSAAEWQPGGAGLTLHTIVTAPEAPGRIWLGISAAGVFASEDGGATWERRNRRSNAVPPPDHPAGGDGHEIGHCVHNIVRASGETDLLYQQNHHGVFRSRDGGRSWDDVTPGLPSTFGFPVAVHPARPGTIWTLPLNGDSAGRYPPDAAAAVWKSEDAGDSWTAQRAGLPQRSCFFTVLRQAMATDRAEPAGVYFGTNSGSVFASLDAGKNWSEIARHLPTILSVETLSRT
ncbi:WD40/YVTN/BNR-like repeat-containing protein [Roseivivax isoporae]|uniref:Glycoside hydrolase n=1 Tax=Roseivivax isoporae LMG 25204 TaxID=1449351 RepID=X7F6Q1_9RHOB|nr:sialidase family protein [Roseivivax isoporae]ETX27759.1 glycoside hydrolase [Roseivivax isoporae LMG 25204]